MDPASVQRLTSDYPGTGLQCSTSPLGTACANFIPTAGKATGYPRVPRTHPLNSLGMPSRVSDAHLGGLSLGV